MQAWAMHNAVLHGHEDVGTCYWYNQSFDATNPGHIEVDDDHIDQDFYVYVKPKLLNNYA